MELRIPKRSVALSIAFFVLALPAMAQDQIGQGSSRAAADVGVVSFVKVVSSNVPDASSLEAWQRSFIKEGMTDEEKALACWKTIVSFQHQDSPPREYLTNEDTVCDAIKVFNVYGYGFCSMASAEMASLARHVNLPTRGWGINRHSVPEVYWGDTWHLLDASLVNYFKHPDGRIASVEDLIAATNSWYEKHPGYRGNDKRLVELHREGGWQGWHQGPDLLKTSPTMDATGWWPARTHGWYSTMQEYDGSNGGGGKAFLYEYGYSEGYRVNIQLRSGERLVRNWSNKGLQISSREGSGTPGCLAGQIGQGALAYTQKFGDIAPGRIGNGIHEYEMPVTTGEYRLGALRVENLADDKAAVKDSAKPGILELRMPSSYVYLSGSLHYQAKGTATVSFSDNHGLDWREISKGTGSQEIDLSPFVFRRYDYRLRIQLDGAGAALERLRVVHDVQHSQRALPALAKGRNTISFSSGPAEGTVTVEGSVNPANKTKQLTYLDYHPKVNGFGENLFIGDTGKGDITFSISSPGEMSRIRFGAHYRARDKRDGIDYQISTNDGASWKTVDRAPGGVAGFCKYGTYEVPSGVRNVLVRYAGTSRNATGILGFRIDADYVEPFGGFRPVKMTYEWDENGTPKQHVFIAKSPSETYSIDCAEQPTMKSVTLELVK